jgi:type II secretory pathway predicted ATPase ExeA
MPIRSALLFNPVLTRDEFLEMMLDEYDVHCSSTSKPSRLGALHRMLLETQRTRGTAVLFIDEAHLLSPELLEEIRLLGNADTHDGKLMQIVLSGQPELLAIMERKELSALQQRVAARANLRPLSLSETKTYVTERLNAAGLQGLSPFPTPALETIHSFSAGVPRLINLIADGCLTLGFRNQWRLIQTSVVEEVAAAMGLGLSGVPPAAREGLREPVWQRKTAVAGEAPLVFEPVRASATSKVEPIEESAPVLAPPQSVLIMSRSNDSEVAPNQPAPQQTAVDRMIEVMKQNRAVARGAR